MIKERVPGTTTDSVRYDDRDAVVRQSDSSGLGSRRLGNDALGRVISDTLAGDAIARRGYGALSDTLFDRNGSKTMVTRDLLGRTVSVSSYAGATAFTTLYFYTVQSDGTERDSVSYPDGSWEVTVLDRDGRTIQKQDSRGVSIQYTTDNDADTVAWSKGEESLELRVSRDSLGRVSTLTRFENGTDVAGTSYTRDGVGRPATIVETEGSSTRTLSYSYDDASRAVTLTLPDGKTVVRSMDVRGRLARVDLDGAKAVVYKYSMNLLTSDTLGNGIIRSYGYSFGRLDSLRHEKDGSLVSGHRLDWDSYGYLDWDRRSPVLNTSEHYGQDKEGQLKEWLQGTDNDGNGTIDALVDSLGWTLDSLGNWKAVYDSKVAIDTRTHNGVNEILTRNGQPFVYDDAGNLTSDGSKSYDWTLDGLLAKVALSDGRSVEYAYDAMRRLVKRTEKDSYGAVMETDSYLWEGWVLLQEERSGTASPETRTYAVSSYPDDMVAMKVEGGSTPGTYYFHRNMTYTTEVVTDQSGQIVERYKLTNPYGKWIAMDGDGVVRTASAIGMRSVFQGSTLQDPLTSMSYFRNRWATEYGTWASRDPAKDEWNDYRLMWNSIDLLDPYGLYTIIYTPNPDTCPAWKNWCNEVAWTNTPKVRFGYKCDSKCHNVVLSGFVDNIDLKMVVKTRFRYNDKGKKKICEYSQLSIAATIFHETMHMRDAQNSADLLAQQIRGIYSSSSECNIAGNQQKHDAFIKFLTWWNLYSSDNELDKIDKALYQLEYFLSSKAGLCHDE